MDYVRTIQHAVGPKVCLDVLHIVLVCQHFVAVTGVLGSPATCDRQVAFIQVERVHTPRLPDLAGEAADVHAGGWESGVVEREVEQEQEEER